MLETRNKPYTTTLGNIRKNPGMIKQYYLISILSFLLISCKKEQKSENIISSNFSELNIEKFTETELEFDFNLLVNSLKEAHTGLYWYNTEKQFDSIVKLQKSKIKDSLNGLEFYNIVAPIVSYTKEGHSYIRTSKDVSKYLNKNGKFIPLIVLSENEKIYILNNPNDKIKIKGLELKKINGKKIEDIYKKLFSTITSDGFIKQSKYRNLDNFHLSTYYAKSIGIFNNYNIEVYDKKLNKYQNLIIKSADINRLSKIVNDVALYSDFEPIDFSIINKNTAIFTINTFQNDDYEEKNLNFKKNVSKTFKKIDSLQIKNLIIDIRENSGGTEGNEDYLFSFLTDKPYNKYKNVEISAFKYSFYKHTDYNKPEDIKEFETDIKKEHYLTKNGKILRKKGIEEIEPLKPKPFKGNIYILTSGWTYSGGAEFSSLMKQHTNAIFIGEEVGGGFHGNTSGYGLEMTLPNTEIKVNIPVLKFSLDVDKGIFGRGVIPDYKIQSTFEDYENKIDRVMEFTKKLITK